MNTYQIKISDKIEKDIQDYMKNLEYASFSEFVRDAIRDKLYGEELTPEFKEKIKEGLEDIKEGKVSTTNHTIKRIQLDLFNYFI